MTNKIASTDIESNQELTLEAVKKRSVKGIIFLTLRTFLLQAISFAAQGLLWLFISPSEFGVFLLVTATVNFLSYFADIGLGAALIQKKEKPEKSDYYTVFIVQEVLVLSVVIIVFLISPFLAKTHSLSPEALMLLYALNISFFLASLKNIPSIILERKLEFGKFIVPQILENVIYSVSLVYFAWKGYGITSFTYAVLLRGVLGLIAIYVIQPWVPKLGFSKKSLHELLKYGIPYQLNNFLATLKDDGITILLGNILGSYALGILGTAQKLSQYPLRFFMDNVNKVTFPAFSRMQSDKDDLSRFLNRTMFFICALVYPSLVGLIVLFPVLINAIPRYQKWEPALTPLVFFSINSMWAAFTTQITNILAAIGKIKVNLKLMIMWTTLSWVLIPLLSKAWGVNGAAIAYAIVSSSSFIAVFLIKSDVKLLIGESVLKPLIASLGMGIFIYIIRGFVGQYDIPRLVFLILLGGGFYMTLLYALVGQNLIIDAKKLYQEIKNKR